VHTGFWWGNVNKGDRLEDTGIDGRIILRRIFRRWGGSMDWIGLTQDTDRWLALVNAVMKLRVPYIP